MSRSATTTVFILASVFLVSGAAQTVRAAATTTPSKGETLLQTTINAGSARAAELSALRDSNMGIIHTLARKATGNDVKLLQQFLKSYGVYPEGLITGNFGPLTEQAVKRFQEKESIDAIGIVGPKTRARITGISRQKVSQAATFVATASTTPAITEAVLATDIADNGSALISATSFASTTPNIYAVLSLANAQQNTEIAYIRYYGNTYVDSGVSHPSRSKLKYLHFQWSLKPGKSRVVGNYSLMFYLNGTKTNTISYSIY